FLKPLLTHARPLLTETCLPVCLPLARLLTTDEQLTRASVHRDLFSNSMDDERPIGSAPGEASSGLSNANHDNSGLSNAAFSGLETPSSPTFMAVAAVPSSVSIDLYDGHIV
uniref:PX domain-containing protein n=1 Tax=Macrostomum lignano TaxID=282301 RepID=A0A1I8FZL2_9PLAT